MTASYALAVASVFTWLGMVVAISFVEAPLKFRAPGVTVPIGLGIGRLVFRALNAVETAWAVALVAALIIGQQWPGLTTTAVGVAIGALAVQVIVVRPALTRRSDEVLAARGDTPAGRSNAHLWYVGLELLKVAALITAGARLLSE